MKSDGSKDAEAWREKDTGGPRRLQANKCSGPELASHTNAITVECCDEPTEDCSDGYPHTCNAGCAGLLLPFWDDCCAQLADLARVKLGSRPREPLRHRLLRLPSAGDTAAPLQHRAKGIILKDLTEGDPGRLLAPFAHPSGRETVGLTAFPAAPPGLVLRCCCCSGRCCKLWLTCVMCPDYRPSAMIGA